MGRRGDRGRRRGRRSHRGDLRSGARLRDRDGDGPVGGVGRPVRPELQRTVGGRYDYTIRNCHNYAVERKLDLRRPIVGYPDGKCHRIPANSSIRDWVSLPDSVSIAGMKPC